MDKLEFATNVITSIVDTGVIAREVNGTWELTVPLYGYTQGMTFHDRKELIAKLANGACAQFGGQGELKKVG
jgi:hypothetical protein